MTQKEFIELSNKYKIVASSNDWWKKMTKEEGIERFEMIKAEFRSAFGDEKK